MNFSQRRSPLFVAVMNSTTFAVKNGQVPMFDFEEIIPEKYCENIQFRDILFFLISLSQVKRIEFNYRKLLNQYEECLEKKVASIKLLHWRKKSAGSDTCHKPAVPIFLAGMSIEF